MTATTTTATASSSSSIIRTALDALGAKRSVLSVGYNHDIIPNNGERYHELLNLMFSASASSFEGNVIVMKQQPQQHQSPLINAGYAVRMSIVTSAIDSFLRFHHHHHDKTTTAVQLVFLGCGLDILGLWAHSLEYASSHDNNNNNNNNVTIFELDTSEISNKKRDILLQQNLVHELERCGNGCGDDDEEVLKGRIVDSQPLDKLLSSTPNYHLLACDLRKTKAVHQCLERVDKSIPTMVISELVVTYLGRDPMDKLLQWCAATLCTTPGSVMAAYEPLGPKAPIRHSVVEGYKEQYCNKFRDKLSRGLAKSNPDELFHPLGCDTASVISRYSTAGFSTPQAALAGYALRRTIQSPEPFDEHAALDLHLRSYVFALGFAKYTPVPMIRQLCPWSTVSKSEFVTRVIHSEGNDACMLRKINAKDQASVKELYRKTYDHLLEEYPSVRKMVKTGLKTDLKVDSDDVKQQFSTIGARFQMTGGTFVVAVDKEDSVLLGCVGLRRLPPHESKLRGDQGNNIFEIHRLSVNPDYRGRGVGKGLLEALADFVQREIGEEEAYNFIATTPAILVAANTLYSSCGFELEKEEKFGKMVINTYRRRSQTLRVSK